jgi:hypothetical protein
MGNMRGRVEAEDELEDEVEDEEEETFEEEGNHKGSERSNTPTRPTKQQNSTRPDEKARRKINHSRCLRRRWDSR